MPNAEHIFSSDPIEGARFLRYQEKICSAFGITLSQFFSEDDSSILYLTDTQKKLLEASSNLTQKQQDALIDLLKTL